MSQNSLLLCSGNGTCTPNSLPTAYPPKKKTRLWTKRRHKLHLGGLGVGSDGAKVLELSRPGEGRGLFHATLIRRPIG